MKSMAHAPHGIVAVLVLLAGAGDVLAYYPPNCFPQHAKDDFNRSALVVVGRVTAIQRFRCLPPAKEASLNRPVEFFYLATITVGQTMRGKAKPGDDILFYTGSYSQREEDETNPSHLRVANSHPAWTLEYNHVYLLALDPAGGDNWQVEERRDGRWSPAVLNKSQIWEPRSCHFSVHEVAVSRRKVGTTKHPDGSETVTVVPQTYVTLYFDRWSKPSSGNGCILLTDFLAAQGKGEFPLEKSTGSSSDPKVNPQDAPPPQR